MKNYNPVSITWCLKLGEPFVKICYLEKKSDVLFHYSFAVAANLAFEANSTRTGSEFLLKPNDAYSFLQKHSENLNFDDLEVEKMYDHYYKAEFAVGSKIIKSYCYYSLERILQFAMKEDGDFCIIISRVRVPENGIPTEECLSKTLFVVSVDKATKTFGDLLYNTEDITVDEYVKILNTIPDPETINCFIDLFKKKARKKVWHE